MDFVEVQDWARDGEILWNFFFEPCYASPSSMVEMVTFWGDLILFC